MEAYDTIIHRTNTAIAKYSDTEDISSLTFLIIFKALLLLVSIAAVTIKYGYTLKHLVFIGVLCLLFLLYRSWMIKASTKNNKSAAYTRIDPSDKFNYGKMMLEYWITGMEVKLARLKSVRLFYIVLTPLFLICSKEFYSGLLDTKPLIFSLTVIYPISYWLWNLYFSKDQKEFESLSITARGMKSEFVKLEQEFVAKDN